MSNISAREYVTLNYPGAEPGSKTLLTGIRGVDSRCDEVYISGFYESGVTGDITPSFIYKGNTKGEGNWYNLNYPSELGRNVTSTSLYGPNNKARHNEIRVVGNYTTKEGGNQAFGCIYEGNIDGSGKWTTLNVPSDEPVINTIAHSNMGNLVVGNYDTNLIQGKAFIYDIVEKTYQYIEKDGASSITAYGIWHNCCNWYTICGGYFSLPGKQVAYLVDWNNHTKTLCNWRSYQYNNDALKSIITHFDGITGNYNGGYNLTGDAIYINKPVAFFATVNRNECHSYFEGAKWEPISFSENSETSGNSVYRRSVIGVYKLENSEEVNGFISNI